MSSRVCGTIPGALVEPDGSVRFRFWAPDADNVRVLLSGETSLPMRRADGWHELVTDQATSGTRYVYILPDGTRVPDPASRFQPDDVHGESEVIDAAAYDWTIAWSGRDWKDIVIYELHIGAFTREGTFRAAIGKLDHLAALGVTAIEIMPVADFPGRRNWGYDGVLPYAPDASYGRPEDLKALVEAAHARGVAVLLDVVYNHFGPDGNYLAAYASSFFHEGRQTPWGAAINYDSAQARNFAIGNALYWLLEFDLDGLRLDAAHAILDEGDRHLLDELAEQLRETIDRPVHLILENEENDVRLLKRQDGEPMLYTAQWNDDVHHVLHVAATRENAGYYADYAGRTDLLARALAEGFAFQGETMPYRGSPRGRLSACLPPSAFVAFIQNHDQIGNRAFGERLCALAPEAVLRALSAVYLLLPQTPMLFMGEEWGARQPFPFFCDFSGELAERVRKGRREEFARFTDFVDPRMRARIPDPLAEATFDAAKLDWDNFDERHLARYRALLAVRRREIAPLIGAIECGGESAILGQNAVEIKWRAGSSVALLLSANLSERSVCFPPQEGRCVWMEGDAPSLLDPAALGPWAVRWRIAGAQ